MKGRRNDDATDLSFERREATMTENSWPVSRLDGKSVPIWSSTEDDLRSAGASARRERAFLRFHAEMRELIRDDALLAQAGARGRLFAVPFSESGLPAFLEQAEGEFVQLDRASSAEIRQAARLHQAIAAAHLEEAAHLLAFATTEVEPAEINEFRLELERSRPLGESKRPAAPSH